MHPSDGTLRAHHDLELSALERERVEAHLAACERCKARAQALANLAERTGSRLAILSRRAAEAPPEAGAARAHVQARLVAQEKTTMLQRLFSRQHRLAWAGLAILALLAISLAFSPIRAIASSFLGLFRIQQFTIVQVDPGDLPEQLGSSVAFQRIFSEDVQFEQLGERQSVADPARASEIAGIPVRLPTEMEGEPQLEIEPGGKASILIDLPHLKTLLKEIGREDIRLDPRLDGATVTLEVPISVAAHYGTCPSDSQAAREAGFDPDEPSSWEADCTTLMQLASPSISAPPGLDVAGIGQAFLQLLGMTPEEAARFSQTVDWTTTLVVPIPQYGVTYEEVVVDGVKAALIRQVLAESPDRYVLVWVKDGLLFALSGPGDGSNAQTIANSLK